MQELVDACHSLPMMIEPQKMWLTLPYGSDTPIYTQHQNGSLTIRIFSVVETSCGEGSPSKIWKAAGQLSKILISETPQVVFVHISDRIFDLWSAFIDSIDLILTRQ